MMFDGGSGWWVIFPIIGLVFLVLLVIFLVLLMSRMFGASGRGSGSGEGMIPMGTMGGEQREHDDDALEVLRRRYAAGELTDKEFDVMRRKLEGT